MKSIFNLGLGFVLLLWAFVAYGDAESSYNNTCAACHNLGVMGAPKLGDKEAWKERLLQGHKTLYQHAIEGFTGNIGVMPPKGGFTSLSDNEVKTIVEFMVSKSR
jgi:cytochrome c5